MSAAELNPTTASDMEAAPLGGGLGLVDALLRDHASILSRIEDAKDLGGLARGLVAVIAVSAALFGAAMGAYRGGIQVLFAGVKLPMVLLFSMAICAPAFAALRAAARGRFDARRDACLVLASLAAASLLISGCAPVMLLAGFWEVDYHRAILVAVACCSVGGLFGMTLFFRGVRREATPARLLIALALGGVFAGVGAQMSWTLRPYLVRPRIEQPPFLHDRMEGSFFEAVGMTYDSARGRYFRPEAPGPEGRR